jgi:glycerol-3-phosphate acyltransferase PlsX
MFPVRIAIDAMGGDHGSAIVVQGVIQAKRAHGDAFDVVLCGDTRKLSRLLRSLSASDRRSMGDFETEHCPDVVTQSDRPSRAWRSKARSSIVRCVSLQKEGRADVSISAGDTGTLLAASVFVLGLQKGVSRPALAAYLPTAGGKPSLILDVGANLECRAEHLVSFGLLGSACVARTVDIDTPRVTLLNIGKEATKGTTAIRDAAAELARRCPGYAGFVEGSEVLSGAADVVVCDGFAGNVLLKTCESLHSLVASVFRGNPSMLVAVRKRMTALNAENYGAAPLLGVNGTILKAHGYSSAAAIANAIGTAVTFAYSRSASTHTGVNRKA